MAIQSLLHGGDFPGLTAFFSLPYMVAFLPAALLIYSIAPNKWKKYVLLMESLAFFWLISGVRILYILVSIISVWSCGIWLDSLHSRRDKDVKAAEKAERKAIKLAYTQQCKRVLLLFVLLNIGILLIVKYSGFFMENVNRLFRQQFPVPSIFMPIGISFYTLSAVSYVIDVYREIIPADRNIFRLSLFLTFFPQIVEGPICRYGQTAEQLWNVHGITYPNFVRGSQRILYGLMKKLVIADRLNPFVESVFVGFSDYPGGWIAVAAVCYTIQLYMDFSGSMDAVCGISEILGITMPENFRQPFFSRTISDFWSRWHISLGSWFKDYIFYPVTMSKSMKNLTSAARKKIGNHFGPLIAGGIALFCVWFCNGLWHGAAWTFIFFGMYHFGIILTGNMIAPYVKKMQQRLKIDPNCWPYRLMQICRTCILVVIGELFFRAEYMRAGLYMLRSIFTDFHLHSLPTAELAALLNASMVNPADFLIVGITAAIVFAVSLIHEKGVSLRDTLAAKPTAVRWAVLYALILYILIFGAYGYGYIPVDPMYANF